MDNIQRLALCLFFLLATSITTQVHAETIPATATPTYTAKTTHYTNSVFTTAPYATKAALCAAHAVYLEASANTSYDGVTCTHPNGTDVNAPLSYGVTAPNWFNPGSAYFEYTAQQVSACPAGYANTGQTGANACVKYTYSCPAATPPWTLVGQNCTRSDCYLKTGQLAEEATYSDTDLDGKLPPITCIQSCQAIINSQGPGGMNCAYGSTGVGTCIYTIHGKYLYSGAACSEGTPVPPAPAPDNPNCPECDCMESGGSWGQINGVNACVPRGTPGSSPVTETRPPKETTTTPAPTSENPNPTPVTTTQPGKTVTVTPAPAGSPEGTQPQVTTTTTNPDGSTTTETDSLGGHCEENPDSQLCGEGNEGFSGTCESGFSCTGDAIQCAISKEQHKRNCAIFDTNTTLSDLGKNLYENNDPDAGSNPALNANATVVNFQTLNADAHFTGSGLQDKVVSLGQFGTLTLPFSKLNSILQIMGMVVLAFAYVAAGRIVGVY